MNTLIIRFFILKNSVIFYLLCLRFRTNRLACIDLSFNSSIELYFYLAIQYEIPRTEVSNIFNKSNFGINS